MSEQNDVYGYRPQDQTTTYQWMPPGNVFKTTGHVPKTVPWWQRMCVSLIRDVVNSYHIQRTQGESTVFQVRNLNSTQMGQVTKTCKHCKSWNEAEKWVAYGDNCRIYNGWFTPGAIAAIGSHNAKCDTQWEEDLRDGRWPDFTIFSQDLCVPKLVDKRLGRYLLVSTIG